jgi:glucose-1-phosphate cytidylyltransferase
VILAGYKGEMIREYFLNFKKYSQDIRFNLRDPEQVEYLSADTVPDWEVTILDTGADAETGGRLRAARTQLEQRGKFFLTYGDGLANVDLRELWDSHQSAGSLVTVSVTKARSKFGHVILDPENLVTGFEEKPRVPDFVNMGYFLIEPTALDYIQEDEPWEASPMTRLADGGQMNAYRHEGFFQSMDTLKEMELLNDIARSASPYPWLTDKLSKRHSKR